MAATLLPAQTEVKKGKPVVVPLKPATLKAGELRRGAGLTADPPSAVLRLELKTQKWLLLDLNADGKIVPGEDGLGLQGHFAVALPAELWCDLGPCEIACDGLKSATLTPRVVADAAAVGPASALNVFRVRHGLKPLLFADDLAPAIGKHLEYLSLNGLKAPNQMNDLDDEREGKPGYSKEGDAASETAHYGVATGALAEDCETHLAEAAGRIPFLNSALTSVAVGAKGPWFMIRFGKIDARGDFVVSPPDGGRDVPTRYGHGRSKIDLPRPLDKKTARTVGYPLVAFLSPDEAQHTLESFTLKTSAGADVKGVAAGPDKPLDGKRRTDFDVFALFIPENPLDANTVYTATLQLKSVPAKTWSFTTGAK
jgi:hypothetical protein